MRNNLLAGLGDHPATQDDPYRRPGYRFYVLVVLTLLYACHAIDRGIPNILLEPIRMEFDLNDSQLGAFSGVAWALAFSVTILPLGMISDRVNRRNFLTVIVVIWSLCTALGGLARTFAQLLLSRVGVGAAEAGAAPTMLPMISDIFPPERRASALGIFYMSASLGVFVASVGGGFVAAEYGWRMAFFMAGVPGLALAILLLLTVKEPRRGGAGAAQPPASKPSVRDVFAYLLRTPGLLILIAACSCMTMVNVTLLAWLASFFIRVHGVDLKQAGLILGLGGGLGSLVGPPLAGWMSDRLVKRGANWPLLMVAGGAVIAFAFGMLNLFAASLALAVVGFIVCDICRTGFMPPCFSVLLENTSPQLRGSMVAVSQLSVNLFGYGLGPLLTGVLSDHYGGGEGIRYALANTTCLLLVVSVLLVIAARTLDRRQES